MVLTLGLSGGYWAGRTSESPTISSTCRAGEETRNSGFNKRLLLKIYDETKCLLHWREARGLVFLVLQSLPPHHIHLKDNALQCALIN